MVAGFSPPQTLPYIVEFCSLCEWSLHCWRHLEQLDHLVRVANIRRDNVRRLESAGIDTLTKLGDTKTAAAYIQKGSQLGLPFEAHWLQLKLQRASGQAA